MFVRPDGTARVRLIAPTWGSSGYYSEALLQRDGPRVFKAGTKSYWNHQTATEERERPEGDLRNLAGELVTDAVYEKNGPVGPGLYADMKVFQPFQDLVEELAPHIGLSIRAVGEAENGEAEGRQGRLIKTFKFARSADFVTLPGAAGQVVEMFEAIRGHVPVQILESARSPTDPLPDDDTGAIKTDEPAAEEDPMPDPTPTPETQTSEAASLRARADALEAEVRHLRERQVQHDAVELARVEIAQHHFSPKASQRVLETVALAPPMTEEGALDRTRFGTQLQEAITDMLELTVDIVGTNPIRGMGEAGGGASTPQVTAESAADALRAEMKILYPTYSDTAIEVAVRGR